MHCVLSSLRARSHQTNFLSLVRNFSTRLATDRRQNTKVLHSSYWWEPCISRRAITAHPLFLNTPVCAKSHLPRTIYTSSIMSLNGDTRPKRKSSPVHIQDRPSKMTRSDQEYTNGSLSPAPRSDNAFSDGSLDELLPHMTTTADTAEWQATIEKVVKNVVSIHFCQTCSFDTDPAISSEATGFVVDAERGYILTNRHVVGAGPFWGYCIFDNHEEVC